MQETRDTSAAAVELDQRGVGRLSRMGALQQQATAHSHQQRVQVSLMRVEAAFRCEEGSHGACPGRGEPIDPPRLERDPAATRCVVCTEIQNEMR